MGRSDPGPQKYKESNKTDCKFSQKVHHQDKYWTELVFRAKTKEIVTGPRMKNLDKKTQLAFFRRYSTTPGDRFLARYPPNCSRFSRSRSEHDCSIAHYEYYLRHNLYIKSAVERQNVLGFQVKKVSIRDYTPKSLTQEANMGMWI